MTQHMTREEQRTALVSDLQAMGDRSWAARNACATRHIEEAEGRATSALQAENERLREALMPFAETAGFFDADGNDFQRDYEDNFTLGDPDGDDVLSTLTVGDLRRALTAVSATQLAMWQADRERLDWILKKAPFHESFDRAAIDAAMDREGRGDG